MPRPSSHWTHSRPWALAEWYPTPRGERTSSFGETWAFVVVPGAWRLGPVAAPSPVLGCRQCLVCLKNPLQGEQTAGSAARAATLRAQAGQHQST
jgi:hypothetical protein